MIGVLIKTFLQNQARPLQPLVLQLLPRFSNLLFREYNSAVEEIKE